MRQVFISYKREEREAARRLADCLESEGLSVWWDPQLRAGERFDDVIESAINGSSSVVVLWSRASVGSTYVRDEASLALKLGKLVPVNIDGVTVPFRFQGIHTHSLLDWSGLQPGPDFELLIRDLREKAEWSEVATHLRPATEHRIAGPIRKKARYGSRAFWAMTVASSVTLGTGALAWHLLWPKSTPGKGVSWETLEFPASSSPRRVVVTGVAEAHVSPPGSMEARILVDGDITPCNSERLDVKSAEAGYSPYKSLTVSCLVDLYPGLPHIIRLEAPNRNADSLRARLFTNSE
jgi:hypothetical protein